MSDIATNNFDLSKKENLGQLQVFKSIIVFAHDNGVGKSGAGVIGSPEEIRSTIVQAFQASPPLRELFRQCLNETSVIKIFK